jgi:hypothetical protein
VSNDAALEAEIALRVALEGEYDAYVVSNDSDISNIKTDLVSLDGMFQATSLAPLGDDAAAGVQISFDTYDVLPCALLIHVIINGLHLTVGSDYTVLVNNDGSIVGIQMDQALYEGDLISFLGVKAFALASAA